MLSDGFTSGELRELHRLKAQREGALAAEKAMPAWISEPGASENALPTLPEVPAILDAGPEMRWPIYEWNEWWAAHQARRQRQSAVPRAQSAPLRFLRRFLARRGREGA